MTTENMTYSLESFVWAYLLKVAKLFEMLRESCYKIDNVLIKATDATTDGVSNVEYPK